MAIYRYQVVLDHDSALPEDVTVNTWHYDVPDAGDRELPAAKIEDFYNTNPSGEASAVEDFLSAALAGTARTKIYNLSDPEPRVPVATLEWTFTPGTDRLPSEVALCASIQAPQESGEPQARRRGRIFLGPLADEALALATGRPSTTCIDIVAKALRDLIADSETSTDYALCVYSTVDNVGYQVTNGWVDNAFDTQRRRGLAPTVRTLVTAFVP